MVACEKYTPEQDPVLFAKHGAGYVERRVHPFIERVAAQMAVMDGGERCAYIEVSERSTPLCVMLFADFYDGVRMRIREDDPDHPEFSRWDELETGP